jgi:hypothetical protein
VKVCDLRRELDYYDENSEVVVGINLKEWGYVSKEIVDVEIGPNKEMTIFINMYQLKPEQTL